MRACPWRSAWCLACGVWAEPSSLLACFFLVVGRGEFPGGRVCRHACTLCQPFSFSIASLHMLFPSSTQHYFSPSCLLTGSQQYYWDRGTPEHRPLPFLLGCCQPSFSFYLLHSVAFPYTSLLSFHHASLSFPTYLLYWKEHMYISMVVVCVLPAILCFGLSLPDSGFP